MLKRAPEWQPSRLINSSLKIRIEPPACATIWRFEFKRPHLRLTALLVLTFFSAIATASLVWFNRTTESFSMLKAATAAQQQQLQALDAQAGAIDRQLRELKAQNRELRGLIGAPDKKRDDAASRHASLDRPAAIAAVESHLAALRDETVKTAREQQHLHLLALSILNMRHLEAISRARVLSEIPSIKPVDYDSIASTFGWRTDPWPEFHQGLDLDADVGTPVRSTAAGTVVFAGWEGGFGQKVVVDHHNGFQTWYCHLSRIDVHVGDSVTKGRVIAAVGTTGETTGPHLHYQVMKSGQAINPMPFLSGVPAGEIASLK